MLLLLFSFFAKRILNYRLSGKILCRCAFAFPCGLSGLFFAQPVCLESLLSDDVVECLVASAPAFWLEDMLRVSSGTKFP